MRRRAGVAAIQKHKLTQEKYRDKGSELQENQIEQLFKQLEVFQGNLEEFAAKHKQEIKKNPLFRKQFQDMCTSIGVDPLASGKGLWSVLGIGDFYYELAVQIVEVCLATNHKNGGLISLNELREKLIKARGRSTLHQEISNDDLLRAARKLRVFGNGFSIVPLGHGQYFVQSVPGELSMDHTALLQQVASSSKAYTSVRCLQEELNWEEERSSRALNHMVKEGLGWVDEQGAEKLFWFPSLFAPCIQSSVDG